MHAVTTIDRSHVTTARTSVDHPDPEYPEKLFCLTPKEITRC